MPVFTPVRPYKCTTYKINESSVSDIIFELIRANNIIEFIKKKRMVFNELQIGASLC